VKDNHLLRATAKISVLMVPRLCPLVLLVKISWTQGRSLWIYDGKVTAGHCCSVHHGQGVVLWAGLFKLSYCTLQRTLCLSIIQRYQRMFVHVMDIHWENHTKHTTALFEQKAHFLNVPAGGIYSYSWATSVYYCRCALANFTHRLFSLSAGFMARATFACKCFARVRIFLYCSVPARTGGGGVLEGPLQPFCYTCLLPISCSSLTLQKIHNPSFCCFNPLLLFTSFLPGIWTVFWRPTHSICCCLR
jgi:hypothetical protein